MVRFTLKLTFYKIDVRENAFVLSFQKVFISKQSISVST